MRNFNIPIYQLFYLKLLRLQLKIFKWPGPVSDWNNEIVVRSKIIQRVLCRENRSDISLSFFQYLHWE